MCIIEEISENNYENWKFIFKKYLLFYNSKLSEKIIRNTWNNIINKEKPINCIGCYETSKIKKKQLVGIMNFIYHKSTWIENNVCYLEDLFILEDYRSRGYASALFNHLTTICNINNVNRIYWKTKSDNHIAQSLYNKLALKTNFLEYEILLKN
tara:strand:+ start:41 stop:502 length:462 start_codon:yes stop_codon:yes gene_type:complete